jgi:hypothetical protein
MLSDSSWDFLDLLELTLRPMYEAMTALEGNDVDLPFFALAILFQLRADLGDLQTALLTHASFLRLQAQFDSHFEDGEEGEGWAELWPRAIASVISGLDRRLQDHEDRDGALRPLFLGILMNPRCDSVIVFPNRQESKFYADMAEEARDFIRLTVREPANAQTIGPRRAMRGMIVEAAEDEWARWQRQRPTLSGHEGCDLLGECPLCFPEARGIGTDAGCPGGDDRAPVASFLGSACMPGLQHGSVEARDNREPIFHQSGQGDQRAHPAAVCPEILGLD